jgi:hypothetical protein
MSNDERRFALMYPRPLEGVDQVLEEEELQRENALNSEMLN